MTTRILKTPDDMPALGRYLRTRSFPMTVSVKSGIDQSDAQRNLSFLWYNDIGKQLDGWDAMSARAECKLNIGVAMLHTENAEFREAWDRLIAGRYDYTELLDLMLPPHNYPVTRIMKAKQMRQFLDKIWDRFTALGVRLTDPEAMKYEKEMMG